MHVAAVYRVKLCIDTKLILAGCKTDLGSR